MQTAQSAPIAVDLKIAELGGSPHICERLSELGFRPGLVIRVLGQAPFGGPLMVLVQNSVVALRAEEAQCLIVQ